MPTRSRSGSAAPVSRTLCVATATVLAANTAITAADSSQSLQQLLDDAALSSASAKAALLSFLDGVDEESLPSNLLESWQPSARRELLLTSLEERSLPGVRFAMSQGVCSAASSEEVLSMLTGTMEWCASRSLRYRIQDFLIGKSQGPSPVMVLRQGRQGDGEDDEQLEMVKELERRIPFLKWRGAVRLHALLRERALAASEAEAQHWQYEVATALQDDIGMALCFPFLSALVSGCGQRMALDASHVAANLASMGGNGSVAILEQLSARGYRLSNYENGHGEYMRCLSCPQCCLKDGVALLTSHDEAMRFSAPHAAAAAGRKDVLSWLEQHDGVSHASARAMLFDATNVSDVRGSSGGGVATAANVAGAEDGGWPSTAATPSMLAAEGAACEIHSVSGVSVMADPAAFVESFVRNAQPVIIRNLLAADGALATVRTTFARSALVARLGASTWEVGDIPYEGRYRESTRAPMSIADYVATHLDGCAGGICSSYPYVFAEKFSKRSRQVSFAKERLVGTPTWVQRGGVRPGKATQFYLGGARSGAPSHFHQAAYNLLVYGKKRWFLSPPSHAVFSMRPTQAWLEEQLPLLRASNASLFECDQHAGDLLIVPDLWGHLTYNLDTSVGIAQEFMYM